MLHNYKIEEEEEKEEDKMIKKSTQITQPSKNDTHKNNKIQKEKFNKLCLIMNDFNFPNISDLITL